ncbi:hypothetical protein M6D93_06985 [Jatrophihabitans telluris]|uniref:Uncharacterized protein n=1 Tax=Jatrophihabitans telluris TaxID=2038343 RepID=A0ABY4R2M9_9ACTN|nr:hypothetical protein [Jatrophihabitans telluris]UQX89737.1 hypothetical protein M6D93_06985 [Jatrophihabitans telluris]
MGAGGAVDEAGVDEAPAGAEVTALDELTELDTVALIELAAEVGVVLLCPLLQPAVAEPPTTSRATMITARLRIR